ncbi:hypothetical protein HY388_01115 [Candidatus Daviesbacteria bacterium]|nr:hypothetical protein [Candidatus Daviesbacteria bacterium]
MLDVTQILLVLVVMILTVMLVVIGIQVVFILKELKKSIDKLNRVLDNAEEITDNIGRPAMGVNGILGAGVLAGIKEGLQLFKTIRKKEHDERSPSRE